MEDTEYSGVTDLPHKELETNVQKKERKYLTQKRKSKDKMVTEDLQCKLEKNVWAMSYNEWKIKPCTEIGLIRRIVPTVIVYNEENVMQSSLNVGSCNQCANCFTSVRVGIYRGEAATILVNQNNQEPLDLEYITNLRMYSQLKLIKSQQNCLPCILTTFRSFYIISPHHSVPCRTGQRVEQMI